MILALVCFGACALLAQTALPPVTVKVEIVHGPVRLKLEDKSLVWTPTETDVGTSCSFSVRFCAVTTISPRTSEVLAVACAAC